MLKIEDIVNFVSKVLYIVQKNKISIDKAFQRIKHRWKDRESFKVYYDVTADVLRKYYYLKYIVQKCIGSASNKNIVKMWLLLYGDEYFKRKDLVIKYLSKFKKKVKNLNQTLSSLDELKNLDYIKYLSIRYSYPEEFVKSLIQVLPVDKVEKILDSMNFEITWLRVNTLKIDIDKAIKILEQQGVQVEQDKEIPFLLRVIESRRPIHHVEIIKECKVIIQDKASILTVFALNPCENELIYDICAAPGIKTSLIMQLTENKAKIVAIDINRDRIENMIKLLKKYGVNIDRIKFVLGDSRILKFRKIPDKILIDAPCTSSGAISKDPAIKLHLENLSKLDWYVEIQSKLVENVIVQFSGKEVEVVYATCSLLPQEGEEILEKLLEKYYFKLIKPLTYLPNGYAKYSIFDKVCRTFPHIHQCEGFFISKIIT